MCGSCSCRASSTARRARRFARVDSRSWGSATPSDSCSSTSALTEHAYKITDAQVDGLRHAGWSDEQIAEATYDAALFNLLVRLADAFDIHPLALMDADGVPEVIARGPT